MGAAWSGLGTWVQNHHSQLKLAFRVTVAALLSLAVAKFIELPLPLWAVLTAIIVTQMSVGRSLKATTDYLAGTVGGAIYGGAVAIFVPHPNEAALLATLVLAVAPLAVIAAVNPSLASAPVTAIIVLLVPEMTHGSPINSVIDRLAEVAVGGITGCLVSLFLLPSSAHQEVAETTAHTLDRMARALNGLLSGLTRGLDLETLHRLQDGIGQALAQLRAVGTEAERERSARLASGPETGPLLRTLLRLRHDLVMLGRAAVVPLPQAIAARLEPALTQIAAAFPDYLGKSAAALLARKAPPPMDAVEAALDRYTTEIAALRRDGLTRDLSGEAAERLFALGFALEQMHQNFGDLARCVGEWAGVAKPAAEVRPRLQG
ncbi:MULTISPECIES: FUSC family protein [Rhodomicrobium]|uniref:FUSC family protein n=1 Tax=Rhodomicrobium TaxID=1068 RepID=UPI000B4AD4E9|nr:MULTISPECIES: FUSC family protein [Rhodomicrobium]